jgi:hypothetical protein
MAENNDLAHADLRPGTGENGSWQGASSGRTAGSGTAAVASWYKEISNYDFATGSLSTSTSPSGSSPHWSGRTPRSRVWGGPPATARNGGRPTSWRTQQWR